MIRNATRADAADILRIFNDAIAEGFAIWREEALALQDVESWIDGPVAKQAVLVIEDGAGAGGFATLTPFKPMIGWRICTEISLYVDAARRGRGHGGRLIEAACARAEELKLATVVSAIDSENEGSVALHERCGFERIGMIKRAGIKHGALRDVILLQRLLDSSKTPVAMK